MARPSGSATRPIRRRGTAEQGGVTQTSPEDQEASRAMRFKSLSNFMSVQRHGISALTGPYIGAIAGGSGCPRRSHGAHRSRPSRYRCRTSRHAVSGHHPSYAQLLRLRSRGEEIAGLSALRWLEEEGARPSPSAPTTTHRSVGSLSFQINDDSRLTENRCRRWLKAGLSELEQLCD